MKANQFFERFRSLICWQLIAMCFDEVVHEGPDLVEAEFGCGMWIEHRGVIDMFALARKSGFNNKRLYINVALLKRGEVGRHHSDFGGLESTLVYKTGDFNTTTIG